MRHEIAARSGVAFELPAGDTLTVYDPRGEQVADLLAYAKDDIREVISAGRTLDYASKLFLGVGDPLYSNRSNVMLDIVEDTVGRHDFLLTPCSKDTFRIIYGDRDPPPRLFRQSGGGAGAVGYRAGCDPDRVQLLHERDGRRRYGRAQRRTATQPRR